MLRRGQFIGLLATAVAWPLALSAQQSEKALIVYVSSRSADTDAPMLAAVRRGLSETGFIEGRNVTIEYRFADTQYERLPVILTELSRRQVAVILYGGGPPNVQTVINSAKASPIPIVFNTGTDPVQSGLVASLNRPSGKLTGVYSLIGELTPKNIGLLHELVPHAKTVALLQSQVSPGYKQIQSDAAQAASKLGLQLRTLEADTDKEFEAAIETLVRQPVDAMVVATSPFLLTRARQIADVAARHRVPSIYSRREFADAGGLISYGYNVAEGYRQMGIYAGRILKGDKPADLPVIQPTNFEFVINLKAARAMQLTVPTTLLAVADEVIE